MIRVLIADDHPVVRAGLKGILTTEIRDVVFGEAKDGRETLQQLENRNWDLIILDIILPGRSGLDVLKEIKHLQPNLPVLVLSIHPENQYGKRVLIAGASGFMNKEAAPDELVKAVHQILGGRVYVSATLAESLAIHLKPGSDRPLHESLSDREFEILKLLGSGASVTQIARELNLSATTVSTYRARILIKMDLKTTSDLIRYALSNGLTAKP